MCFFFPNQFIVTTVKFEKCFAAYMIPIALFKDFESEDFLTIIEVLKCEDALVN